MVFCTCVYLVTFGNLHCILDPLFSATCRHSPAPPARRACTWPRSTWRRTSRCPAATGWPRDSAHGGQGGVLDVVTHVFDPAVGPAAAGRLGPRPPSQGPAWPTSRKRGLFCVRFALFGAKGTNTNSTNHPATPVHVYPSHTSPLPSLQGRSGLSKPALKRA